MTVVVIGAGPAGLAAASAALRAGADVTLLDSSDQLGGQFWRHLPDSVHAAKQHVLHHKWGTFEALAREVTQHPSCSVVANAQVWLLEQRAAGAPRVHAHVGPVDSGGRETLTLDPHALVLATGAHDRTLPFPGWTLPGVYTAGAAQALAKSERIALGSRAVVAGAGPFLLPVAQSLALTGARVLGVYEATTTAALLRGWGAKPWQLTAAVGKMPELAGYVAGHVRHSIPYRTGRAVVEAHGTDRVEAVTIARVDETWAPIAGTETTIETDAVCVSHGFTPRLELAIAAGCTISADRFVEVDARQQTSIRGIYAAGELTGIAGADAALAEGALAGHFAANGPRSAHIGRAARARDRFIDFGTRLDAVHSPRRGWTQWLRNDTTICRCEEVTNGELTSIQSQTASCGLRSLKLSTRAGLGICQGRICGRNVEELLGEDFADGVTTDRRPIVSPVRIGDLADAAAAEPPTEDPHTAGDLHPRETLKGTS
ncbi:FAD-dependent oxidoreductase [Paramicrobacterium agarici]|uniref:FAD-dependent oxidoreductase n=1 Tax=Paramicrobacterium agarici TaxID=630514 RepID=UPI001174F5A3|nr:FAD-dependent oxidoreductase [Microbacterium agarici]TQO23030.1 pyruvate/2-oxoglutarate dehydrogenase complex dihydrolipoamide dehydrogenase (E3) component [Microbacterium agarici]